MMMHGGCRSKVNRSASKTLARWISRSVPLFIVTLLIASCSTYTGPRYLEPENREQEVINIADPRLVRDVPADVRGKYEIATNGDILDGPKSHIAEPIDFFDLLRNDVVASTFERLAFDVSGESDALNGLTNTTKKDRLRRLEGRISIRFLNEEDKYRIVNGILSEVVREIRKNSGANLTFSRIKGAPSILMMNYIHGRHEMEGVANYLYETAKRVRRKDFEEILRREANKIEDSIESGLVGSCYGSLYRNNQDVDIAFVMIYRQATGFKTESCFYEELIQSLGIFSDHDDNFNSMFTDSFKIYHLPTKLDWYMADLLYREELQSGMHRDEVMPIVRRILAEERPYAEQ